MKRADAKRNRIVAITNEIASARVRLDEATAAYLDAVDRGRKHGITGVFVVPRSSVNLHPRVSPRAKGRQ